MNEPIDHRQDEDADRLLEDLLSPLKSLSPPRESQLANRAAVAAELRCSASVADVRPRWWQRSISVPVPLAAGLAAVVLVALAISFQSTWQSFQTGAPQRTAAPRTRPAEARDVDQMGAPARSAIAGAGRGSRPAAGYYETEIYLCGLGRLSSESGYVIWEEQADD